MKCLSCGHNSLYRERTGGKCSKCQKPFAFEPKTGDAFTDGKFQKALDKISDRGQVSFTRQQLYYELARRKYPGQPPTALARTLMGVIYLAGWCLPILALFKGAPEILTVLAFIYAVLGQLLVIYSLNHFLPKTPVMAPFLPQDGLQKLLTKWQSAHGVCPQLVTTAPEKRLPAGQIDELKHYSVDKVLVCDRKDTVDFLLANRLHMEQKCLIMMAGGYPFFETTELFRQLKQQPRLQIYVLHDASRKGCSLARHLRQQAEWVPKGAQILDLGLNPGHAQKFKKFWRAAQPGHAIPARPHQLPPEDWLSYFELELAVIPPLQLLNRLSRLLRLGAEALDKQRQQGGSESAAEFESDDLIIWGWGELGDAGDLGDDGDFG